MFPFLARKLGLFGAFLRTGAPEKKEGVNSELDRIEKKRVRKLVEGLTFSIRKLAEIRANENDTLVTNSSHGQVKPRLTEKRRTLRGES